MFVFNLKIKAKKTVILAAVLSVTAAIICTAVTVAINSRLPDTAVSDKTGEYSLVLNDGEEKKFLEQFGIETADAKPEKRSVVIRRILINIMRNTTNFRRKSDLTSENLKAKRLRRLQFPLKSQRITMPFCLFTKTG